MRLGGGQEVPYLRGDGWQATELRYQGPDGTTPLAMTLIMPDDLTSFESTVSARQLEQLWTSQALTPAGASTSSTTSIPAACRSLSSR